MILKISSHQSLSNKNAAFYGNFLPPLAPNLTVLQLFFLLLRCASKWVKDVLWWGLNITRKVNVFIRLALQAPHFISNLDPRLFMSLRSGTEGRSSSPLCGSHLAYPFLRSAAVQMSSVYSEWSELCAFKMLGKSVIKLRCRSWPRRQLSNPEHEFPTWWICCCCVWGTTLPFNPSAAVS